MPSSPATCAGVGRPTRRRVRNWGSSGGICRRVSMRPLSGVALFAVFCHAPQGKKKAGGIVSSSLLITLLALVQYKVARLAFFLGQVYVRLLGPEQRQDHRPRDDRHHDQK